VPQQASLQPEELLPPQDDVRCSARIGQGSQQKVLLALGVIANPAAPARRSWLRRTNGRFVCSDGRPCAQQLAQRFVIGTLAARVADASSRCELLLGEAAVHGDLFFVRAVDGPPADHKGPNVGCIDKTFAWYQAALSAFPRAEFIGKTDDDAFHHLPNLEELLLTLRLTPPPIFAGWAQFNSMLPAVHQPCGWSNYGQLAGRKNPSTFTNRSACHVCPSDTPASCRQPHQRALYGAPPPGHPYARRGEGPYLFFVGALQLMTPDLGRRIFHTREVLAFLKSARARVWDVEAPVTAQWMCEYEDATLGWAVWKAAAGESSTVRPSFVALAHGLRAMQQNAIIDVQDLCNTGGSIHVSDHLTVHKLEIDDAALQRRVDAEVDQNTHVFARLHVPPQYFVQEIANCNRRARPFLDAEAAAFSSLNVSARRSRQWVVDCRGPLQMGTFLDSGVAARPYEPSEEFSSLRFATHHGGTRREAADFFGGVARSAPWRYCTAVIQEREGGRGRVVEGEPS